MKYWKHKKLRPRICAGAKKMLRGTTLLRHENMLTPSSALYRERPAKFRMKQSHARSSAYSGGRSLSEAECESHSQSIRSLKISRAEAFSITLQHSFYLLIMKYASENSEKNDRLYPLAAAQSIFASAHPTG